MVLLCAPLRYGFERVENVAFFFVSFKIFWEKGKFDANFHNCLHIQILLQYNKKLIYHVIILLSRI